jgi:hypothetical protein
MKRCLIGVAAVGALAFCVATSGAPRDEKGYTLPPELEGRARIVTVDTVTPVQLTDVRAGLQATTEEALAHPANVVIEVIDDEAAARGAVATGAGEAPVFVSAGDSGYGWFLNNTPDALEEMQMIFGNNWAPGDSLTKVIARVYVSQYNFGAFNGTGGFHIELWDGDPIGWYDTVCSAGGVPAPIPGTLRTWSDLPENTVYDLVSDYGKLQINCDRVHVVVWPNDVCRWAFRMSMGMMGGTPATLGYADGVMAIWGCESFGYCGGSASGYNVGLCCDDVSGAPGTVACDHTNADPLLWTPAGGCNPGVQMHPTFCMDYSADYFFTYYNEAPLYYNHFVSAAYAQTDMLVHVDPVSVDGPPGAGRDVTITATDVTIDEGGPCAQHRLWFEIYFPDWDPGAGGLKLKAFQAGIDSAPYAAGLRGTLSPWRAPCTSDADCVAAYGPVGGPMDPLKGGCNLPGIPTGLCAAGWADGQRTDYIFYMTAHMGGVDQSTKNYRYAGTQSVNPTASPHIGDMYGGTLVLETVNTLHAGDFGVGMLIPNTGTAMVDEFSQFIPLLGVRGAGVHFPLGQCCDIGVSPTYCISDTVTRCECYELGVAMGTTTFFDPTKDCGDPCIECMIDDDCADNDACTKNECVANFCVDTAVNVAANFCCDDVPVDLNADLKGLGVIASNVDGIECSYDLCDNAGGCGANPASACGVPTNPCVPDGTSCYDGEPCLTVEDKCLENVGTGDCECIGTDILTVPCTNDDKCMKLTQDLGSCNFVTGYCRCVPPSLNFDIIPSNKPNGNCFLVGEKINVDVFFKDVPVIVQGGQFVVEYDPDCVKFNGAVPGGAPYTFEIAEIVDEAAGRVFYAVGVDPFGGVGTLGEDVLATLSFTKVGVCETCDFCFGGVNPQNTVLVGPDGQMVDDVVLYCSKDIMENDTLWLKVPDDIEQNSDCDAETAMVSWAAPTAGSSCYDVSLVCGGIHRASGEDLTAIAMTGGEVPNGVSDFWCYATSTICGDSIYDDWTVTVNDATTLDIVLQVSPIIAADELIRCIKFELFSDCVQDPLIVEKDIKLGGVWDHIGHFTDEIKIPDKGQWICITARDQLHTLRACDYLECIDGVYYAVFKGDPYFGGNWLVGGNLDGWKKTVPDASHDVIDIRDFGYFNLMYSTNYGTGDTPCGMYPGPHGDINGDGVVDALDFTFVTMNFLMSSKECCCGGGVAASEALTEVTLEWLRANGLGELAIADLNRDGLLNVDDMTAFMNGVRPVTKVDRKSSIR